MSWRIDIPYRDRDDPISNLGFDARHLDDEQEVAVVRQLAMDAILAGHATVGDLIDDLERLTPTERRTVLDKARASAGLATTGEIEWRREDLAFERREISGPPRWSEIQGCHAPNCKPFPTKNGQIVPTSLERWFCPEHEHLAQPGDLDPHEPPYIGFNPNGRPIPSAKEAARIAAETRARDEPLQRERRRREELRAREGEAIKEAKQRFADEGEISVMGIRVRPDLRIAK